MPEIKYALLVPNFLKREFARYGRVNVFKLDGWLYRCNRKFDGIFWTVEKAVRAATRFDTQDEAEEAAFDAITHHPVLIGLIVVTDLQRFGSVWRRACSESKSQARAPISGRGGPSVKGSTRT